MKIIIDIPDELYTYMQSDKYDEHLDKRFDYKIKFAVKEGTPVKYSQWVNIHDNKGDCNACGEKDMPVWMNFCPICGSDMRGEHANNN